MPVNVDLIETDDLIEALFKRFDHAGFVGQRSTGENDLQERIEMSGQERIIQGLCASLQIRCEAALVGRSDKASY